MDEVDTVCKYETCSGFQFKTVSNIYDQQLQHSNLLNDGIIESCIESEVSDS